MMFALIVFLPILFMRADATDVAVDWDVLSSGLSSPAQLTVIQDFTVWMDQCMPIFAAEKFPYRPLSLASVVNGSNHQLIDQPAGVCAEIVSCAWKYCDWAPTTIEDLNAIVPPLTNLTDYFKPEEVDDDIWNLPAAVVHPTTPSDVIAAIEFATVNGIGMSVKTSGHSYTGSSTDKDSLMLNMRQYPKYLAEGGFLTECEGLNSTEDRLNVTAPNEVFSTDDLRAQACNVAMSRGWKAIMRVGGGTTWDEAYRSLSDWNTQQPNWTYHIVGGGAGTVSAAGGWLSATGLSGTSGMRLFGYGVDQVTQMEMVMPTGHHVRFGPTGWEADKSLAWPRTTKVTGWCNANTSQAAEEWQVCPSDSGINFDDLWHAVRGGGGGFGVVLSVEYQLPDWPGKIAFLTTDLENPELVTAMTELCGECEAEIVGLVVLLGYFYLDALFNPSAVGMTDDKSNLCGAPGGSIFVGFLFCHGEGGRLYADAFSAYVESNRGVILAAGLSDEIVDILKNITVHDSYFMDYPQMLLSGPTPGVPEGKLADSPKPSTTYTFTISNILVPLGFINSEEGRALFLDDAQGLYLTGGNTAAFHDGTTATSATYRQSAMWIDLLPKNQALLEGILSYHFGDGTPQDSFPPIGEFNHMQDYSMGPLKSNWSQACPLPSSTITRVDRELLCIGKMEFVFGTEGLTRLEAIKSTVDPNHLFNCYACVGYREMGIQPSGESAPTPSVAPGPMPTPAPQPTPAPVSDPPSLASGLSSSLATIVGMALIMILL